VLVCYSLLLWVSFPYFCSALLCSSTYYSSSFEKIAFMGGSSFFRPVLLWADVTVSDVCSMTGPTGCSCFHGCFCWMGGLRACLFFPSVHLVLACFLHFLLDHLGLRVCLYSLYYRASSPGSVVLSV
jgi:hypothetical protein